jgi:hypothetical protein
MSEVKIFIQPTKGKGYSLGADIALGLASGDNSTAVVVDCEYNICATFKGKIAPDLFGEFLCRLGHKYNDALITPEINNHGLLTLDRIKSRNYPNIYTRKVEEVRGEDLKDQIGWQTTVKSKNKMLGEFIAAFRDGSIKITDLDIIKEMSTLVIEDDGNVNLNGKDLVVATCLAIQGIPHVIVKGEFKAFTPGKQDTYAGTNDRLKMLNRRMKSE